MYGCQHNLKHVVITNVTIIPSHRTYQDGIAGHYLNLGRSA